MTDSKKRHSRVALLIETSRSYGRGLLRGIGSYIRTHGSWSVFHQERSLHDPPPSWLKNWDGDGIIARLETRELVRGVRRLGLPTVDLRGRYALPGIPVLDTDEKIVAQMAAEHLLDRGFEHFAFCGFNGATYSERRLRFYSAYLADRGLPVHVFLTPGRSRIGAIWTGEAQGIVDQDSLAAWLSRLPKPVGLFACNDVRGQQVLNACRDKKIVVPEEIAVIGVDNDIMLCELCDPPLSSVVPDTEKIGFEAAKLLDRMMKGEKPTNLKTLVKPLGLKTRQSTDTLASTDRDTARAVRFIRNHARDGINVDDVVKQLGISRSTLERRLRRLAGRTPKQEIMRVRLEHVKRLLRETDYPVSIVARMTGFAHPEHLHVTFRRVTGRTPGQYRQALREPKRRIDLLRLSDHDE